MRPTQTTSLARTGEVGADLRVQVKKNEPAGAGSHGKRVWRRNRTGWCGGCLVRLPVDEIFQFLAGLEIRNLLRWNVHLVTGFGVAALAGLALSQAEAAKTAEFDDSRQVGKGDEKIDLKVGESYQMKIIKLAPEERKIGLSIRALKSDEFRADWETYQESSGDGTATLGDHFRNNR